MEYDEIKKRFRSVMDDVDDIEAELHYLRWFKEAADFGPADGDVHDIMDTQYTKETGKPVPKGHTTDDYAHDGRPNWHGSLSGSDA